ncbi:MAG: rhamnulokinase [Clostridia bacterium]|nr:rhamnulokinase [Clostridia bacterium]
MNPTYYLAVDIGASSGRHILGYIENGKLVLEEIYRFPNGMQRKDGRLVWDVDGLFQEIKNGLKVCAAAGKIPSYMGIDTWGVDFVLLDANGERLDDAVGYRDARTAGMDLVVSKTLSEEDLYARTGIQKQAFNTIYQLAAIREKTPELLGKAETLLMIPNYLNARLTGICVNEYTEATTSNLISAQTGDWDYELLDMLRIPQKLFSPVRHAGEVLGELLPEIAAEVGFSLTVMLPATHDTGSAVLAMPTNSDDAIYISSGTWSLIGVERMEPDTSAHSQKHNFTNEGGYAKRYRYLKNIVGLWMIQSIKKELGTYSFPELSAMAQKGIPTAIDVNDSRFLAPDSMIDAVRTVANKPEMSIEDVLASVYHGLASCYAQVVREIEEITGKTYPAIHIIGGGCRDDYLSSLTAQKSQKRVFAGPVEATAIGNILAQMLGCGVFSSVAEARDTVARSFDVTEKT